jgi:cellulose synthase/poly-beta-1,6-N-acetylglucosamine synthase-like glycosyltransferase
MSGRATASPGERPSRRARARGHAPPVLPLPGPARRAIVMRGAAPAAMIALAAGSLALLVYTYVGYPVLIAALARVWPLRTTPDPAFLPRVTACIPVHDAARYVAAKLDSLLALDYPADRLEILVYSDGATDGSDDIVRDYERRDPRVRLVRGERRAGKPTAVNAMRERATGEVLLMTDIRQPLHPGALRALVAALADPTVGCVSGNLVLGGAAGAGAYWRYESRIRDAEARFRSMVGVTGPIYAVRRADLAPLPRDVILDDMWVPMRLRLAGRRLLLCRAAEAYDEAFADEREFGRKVRTLAGNYQILARMPRLLVPFANPSWFETASHKVARLVCPWALAALAVSSVAIAVAPPAGAALPTVTAMRALVAGQALFYAAAAAGPRAGRLAGLARTFVVLNAAAVVGLWRFATGSQRVTW